MPIIKSAVKKMRQDQKRYAQNLRTKRALRTAVKDFENKPTFETLREAQSKLDTAVKKNVLSKAAAGRRMSRLSAAAKKAGVKIAAVKKTAAKAASTTKTTAKPAAKAAAKTTAAKPAAKKAPAKTAAKKPAAKK